MFVGTCVRKLLDICMRERERGEEGRGREHLFGCLGENTCLDVWERTLGWVFVRVICIHTVNILKSIQPCMMGLQVCYKCTYIYTHTYVHTYIPTPRTCFHNFLQRYKYFSTSTLSIFLKRSTLPGAITVMSQLLPEPRSFVIPDMIDARTSSICVRIFVCK